MVNNAAKYIPFFVIGGICTGIGAFQTGVGVFFVLLITRYMFPLIFIGAAVLIFGIAMLATGSRRKKQYGVWQPA